jgi:indole-3-glycerol phosphate synthase
MSDFLSGMAAASLSRARTSRSRVGEGELVRRVSALPSAKPLPLNGPGFDVLAEYKPRSPSGGLLAGSGSCGLEERVAAYAQGGAAAISVLTEPAQFGGSLDALVAVSGSSELPALRKDFLVDPYQVLEARASGASGVLLIARLLDRGLLAEMMEAAAAAGMFVVLEVFAAGELDAAIEACTSARGAVLLGINARDLATLQVDANRHGELVRIAPARLPLVAESGIATPADATRVARLGYRAALVGEALMRIADPATLLAAMIGAGRDAVTRREVVR